MRPLFEACRLLIQTHARRLPLIDYDDQTGKEVVLSVLTQYRVLKFMAVNVSSRLPVDLNAAQQIAAASDIPHFTYPRSLGL